MTWEYTQLRFVPRGKSWTGEIEELWLDDQQLISRSQPQRDVSLVGLMNELGQQGWELVAYAQPFTCLLYTSPSPRDATLSRMPSSA